MGGGEEWELGLVCKMKNDSLFSFLKNNKGKKVAHTYETP